MAEDPEAVQLLKDRIRQRIFSAELPVGTRIGEENLRRETGATFRVVRAALKELTEEGLLQRRQKVGTFVAKKLPESAAGPRLPEISAVGIVSSMGRSSFENSLYLREVMEGIEDALAPGATCEFFLHTVPAKHGLGTMPALDEGHVKNTLQGLISIESNNALNLEDLVRRGIPVVAVDFAAARHAWDVVGVDHIEAGFQATRHLLELGHRRIAFAGERPNPKSNDPTWQARHLGYAKAMLGASREAFGTWLLDTNRDVTVVKTRMQVFHKEFQPTAYVFASSGFLPHALETLAEMGLSCPGDVSLAGADSECPFWKTQTVSTVHAPYNELGRTAVRLLASRLACPALPPVEITLPVDFTPGVTSAVPKG